MKNLVLAGSAAPRGRLKEKPRSFFFSFFFFSPFCVCVCVCVCVLLTDPAGWSMSGRIGRRVDRCGSSSRGRRRRTRTNIDILKGVSSSSTNMSFHLPGKASFSTSVYHHNLLVVVAMNSSLGVYPR